MPAIVTGAGRAAVAVTTAVAGRPGLWTAALVQAWRMGAPGWWRRSPLPLPAPELWRFRMQTAYGGEGEDVPTSEDIVAYLRWCRLMRTWRRQ